MNATTQGTAEVRSRRRPQPLPAWTALLGAVVLLGLAGCSSPGPGRPVPVVTIAPGASPVTEGTAVQFTVRAAPAPAQDLAVSVTVTDAGARLAAAAPQTVTIPAGATAATLTLPTTADAEAEADSAVTATVAAGTGYAPGTPSSAAVTVTDAAAPPSMPVPVVTIAAVSSAVAEGTAVVFALTAAPAPAAELAVSVTVTESGAMLAQPGPRQATFAAGAGSATLTLATIDDAAAEPDSRVTATVTAGSGYTPGAGMATASVRVTDAGQPQPQPLPVVTLAAVVDQVTEGTPARFTVSADRTPAADLAVNVAVTGGAGMLSGVPPASVTIRAGAAAAVLTLETDDDTEVEEASTVTVSLQPGTGYEVGVPGSAGVRVVDDDRVPLVPLFFSYVEFDEPDDRVDTNDPPRRTPESAWPARSLGLPFGAEFVNATGDPPAGASAAHRSCVAIAAPMEPIALERWLALGGTGRTHDVTVLPTAADGMDGIEYAAPGHGFTLSTDAAGATWLAGRPNLAAGDYQWRLNTRDAAGQHEYRGWKFRVTPRAYVSLEGLDIVAGHADLAAGAVENPRPERLRGLTPRRRPHHRLGRLHLQPVRSRRRHCRQPDRFRGGRRHRRVAEPGRRRHRGRLRVGQPGGGPGAERHGRRRRALGGRPDAGRGAQGEGGGNRRARHRHLQPGRRRTPSPPPPHHRRTAGGHACRPGRRGRLRHLPRPGLRQLLPRSDRRHGGAGPLPVELDVPRVVENRKSELGGQDGDLNRVGQQVLAAKLRIVEDRGQKVLPYQVEKAIPKEVGLVLRAEAIHAVNLVNRSCYLRSFVLRYALHREEQLLGQAQLGFLEIDALHQFVHRIVARRCQLPVQLAIDNGEQCFDHDRRTDTELLPVGKANAGESCPDQRRTTEPGGRGKSQQLQGIGLVGGRGRRRAGPVKNNPEGAV